MKDEILDIDDEELDEELDLDDEYLDSYEYDDGYYYEDSNNYMDNGYSDGNNSNNSVSRSTNSVSTNPDKQNNEENNNQNNIQNPNQIGNNKTGVPQQNGNVNNLGQNQGTFGKQNNNSQKNNGEDNQKDNNQNSNAKNVANNNMRTGGTPGLDKMGSKNDSDMLKNKLQSGQNQNLPKLNAMNRENREDGEKEKPASQKFEEDLTAKAGSVALQTLGVPQPLADMASKELAKPIVELERKRRKIIATAAIISAIVIIMVPIICLADIDSLSTYDSEERSNYLYGTGTEEELINYLVRMHYCDNVATCSSSDAYTFYTTLKHMLGNNYNLTEQEADTFIIEMIFYERKAEEAFKQIDEIQQIVSIIGGSKFSLENADDYKQEFIKDDGFIATYRKEDLPEVVDNQSYREKMFDTVVANAKNKVKYIAEVTTVSDATEYNVNGNIISDVQVRLYDSTGETLKSVMSLEDYVLGVVHANASSYSSEVMKTYAIAVRSHTLNAKTIEVEDGNNFGLSKESGVWFLTIMDDPGNPYCDPDKECKLSNEITIEALSEDSEIRKIVEQTKDKAILDSDGEVLDVRYTIQNLRIWQDLADSDKDYYQIIKETYPNAVSLTNGYASTGDYANWKQKPTVLVPNVPWENIPLGASSDTIHSAGCLVTSVAIQIAKSGTTLTVTDFNPGIFVEHLNEYTKKGYNGFTPEGNFWYDSPRTSGIAPNFEFLDTEMKKLTGSRSEKIATIKKYADMGYYIIIGVNNEGHWVALDYVDGENVYIHDPSTDATNLFNAYYESGVCCLRIYRNNG